MLKSLMKSLRPLLKKHRILEDVIIFGSFVRGKSFPKDVDVALLVNYKDENKIDGIESEIRKMLPQFKIDISILTIKDFFHPIWVSIIKEGFSVAKEQYLSSLYGIKPCTLYKYSLKMLNPVQKVQFDRGLKKVIEQLKGIRLTRTVVIIPLNKSEQFEEFLKTWKIEFEARRYSLLPDIKKTEKIWG